MSNSEREFLIKERILKIGQAKVLGAGTIGGIDLNRFSNLDDLRSKCSKQMTSTGKIVQFLFLGRFHPDMGLDKLLEAIPEVS